MADTPNAPSSPTGGALRGGPSAAAPSPAALRRALRRVRDGVALDVTEASVLLAARGEQLDELLGRRVPRPRRGAGRRRPSGRRHLLPQGVRAAHAAVPRPLPLLHVRHRAAPPARGVPRARRGAGDRPRRSRRRVQGGAVHPRRPAGGALARGPRVAGGPRLPLHARVRARVRDRRAGGDGPAAAPQPGRHELGGAHAAQARRAEHGDDAGDHGHAAVVASRAGRTTAARTRSPPSGCGRSPTPGGSASRSPPASSSGSGRRGSSGPSRCSRSGRPPARTGTSRRRSSRTSGRSRTPRWRTTRTPTSTTSPPRSPSPGWCSARRCGCRPRRTSSATSSRSCSAPGSTTGAASRR